jgi:hypothetical protein
MAQSLRNEFHTTVAGLVLSDIQLLKANYYYYLGRLETWGGSDLPPNSSSLSQEQDDSIRSDVIYLKKINPSDVSLVTKRLDWSAGAIYDRWDSTIDMSAKNFYIINSNNQVYKCLDNNNGGTTTTEPNLISYDVFKTADNYLWKYMFTVPAFKRYKFLNTAHIPVQNALSDSFFNKGAVEQAVVTNQGSGYTDTALTVINVTGGTTTGSGATGFKVSSVSGIGAITGVSFTSGGTGYTKGLNYSITSAAGSGAILTPIIAAGVITGFTITNAGVGYSVNDPITITVGGAIIFPSVSRATGQITGVNIIKPGAGYTVAPTLTVVGAGGTGLYGNSTALMTAVVYNGSVQRVLISDPGQNYPADSATTITVTGDGTNAAFSPVIYNGSVIDIIVENPGSGYTFIDLAVVGAGTGATVNGVVTTSDFTSDQAIVEQTTNPGAIYAIKMLTHGAGYNVATTTVTINGDGTGATATPTIVNGVITKIEMDLNAYGNDYTYATVTITDTARIDNPLVENASAVPIYVPNGGHGSDAVNELAGTTLAVSTLLKSESDLISLTQDYRQFGILRNPTNSATGKFFKLDNEIQAFECMFNNITNLVKDEVVLFGSNQYRVAAINSVNSVFLQPISKKSPDPLGGITSVIGGRTYTVTKVLSRPTLDKYSGSLMFVSDEQPFQFTSEQGLAVKTYIKF